MKDDEKDLKDRSVRVDKLRASLHDFLILETKSLKLIPPDATTAILLEACACVCAVAKMNKNPEIAVHFLNICEERIGKCMMELIAELLEEAPPHDKIH